MAIATTAPSTRGFAGLRAPRSHGIALRVDNGVKHCQAAPKRAQKGKLKMLKKEDVLNDPVAPRFELILDRDGVKTNRAVLTHSWLATIVIRGRVYSLIVSAGFEFDGRSVTDYNRYDADYIRAALAHDYLYAAHPIIYLDGEEYVVTRRDADKVYDDLLKRHGKVNIIKRKRDYIFLRIFGGAAWRGHNIEDNERARALGLIMDTGVNVCDLD